MRIQRKPRSEAHLFTGTMADVSFLLIIFFMVTAVFSATKGLDFHPDTEEQPPVVDPRHSIDIHVLADGALLIDGKQMPLSGMLPYIGSKLEKNPDKPVILRTAKDAPYGAMLRILDELRSAPDKAGFEITSLAIPTHREMEQNWLIAGLASS